MKQFKLFFACALMSLLSLGQVWAAADVTYDFTDGTWTVTSGTLSDGSVSFTGAGGANFKMNSGYFILGKKDAYLTFPTYGSAVEKIVVTGRTGASASVEQNIYVGDDAVSTATTGAEGSNTYNIASGYQDAGTVYTLKVTSNHNTQITKIEIFYASGSTDPTLSASPSTIDFGTVEQGASVAAETVAVTFSNLTGSVTYSGLSGAFAATGTISNSGDEITITPSTGTIGNYNQTLTIQSTTDSKSQDVTVTMNVVEPFAGSVLEIVKGDFTTTSYDDNAGDHEKDGITFTTAKVYQSGSSIQFQKTNGLLYNKTDLGEIAKIEITTYTGKANNLVVYAGTEENPSTTEVTGSASGSVKTYTFASGNGFFAIKCNGTGASNVDPIKVYYTPVSSSVETPTFSPVAGTYTSAQSVELSCATDGATIYYTTNGDTPDNTSTPYTSAISVGETMTIKAIAIKESESSAVATATYTINLPLSTMDQIFAAATAAGSTATDVNITFGSWVVSGVSTNGKNVFVTDGTKGFVVFDNGGSMGFAVGDVLSGTAACKVQLYKGAAELTLLTSTTEGLSVATGGSVTPEVKAISALSGINTGAPVTINSVQFDGEYLSDGANSIKPYNSLFAYEALENGKYYNVTGIYQQFGNTTKEILPRSAADIEELTLADPELSYSPASETIEVGDSWSAPTFNNEHGLTVSFSGDNDAVATVNTTTGEIALAGGTGTAVITASFAGNATYAAGNATYTITVNPASVSENVVILAVYDTKYYAMSTNNASNAFTAIEVEYDGSQVTVNSAEDKAAIQWTKKTSGDNTTFQNSADKYMKSADGTSMSLQDAVCNWVWDATGEYYKIDGTTRTFFYQNGTGFKNFAVSNFNKSGYSGKAEVIVIDPANIIISSKVSAELAYDPATLTITQGDAWSVPTLGYVVGFDGLAAITYASDNEAVATVTDAGVISLAGGTGTATITATFAGNANYLAGNATYAITVNAPAATPTGTTYTKVTSTAEITDGEYLIVYEGDATHDAMAFNGSLDNVDQALKAIAVTIVGDEIAGNTDLDAATFTIDVAAGTLQSASGYYIGRTVNSNGMEQDNVNTFTNTFAITDGAAVITGVGGCTLRYNYASDQLRFRYYKSGQQDIQLYKKVVPVVTPETVRTGLEINRYYTVCLPKKITSVTGGTFWTLTYKDAEPATMVYIEEATPPFAAGKPYIFQATATSLQVVYEGDATDVAGTNGALVGTLADLDAAALAAKEGTIYLLIQNALRPNDNNYLSANRAYIRYDWLTVGTPVPAPGKRVRTMPLQGQTITGIDELNTSETPAKLMINGQLFILRGEKMYDAQGRLVK